MAWNQLDHAERAHFLLPTYNFFKCACIASISICPQFYNTSSNAFSFHVIDKYVDYFQDCNRFHEDIFGVTLRTHEVQDKARKQVRKAWHDLYRVTKVANVLRNALPSGD